MQSSQNRNRAISALIILCSLGILASVMAALSAMESASRVQFQITQLQLERESNDAVQHFYQIQREQLELRLNELALQENLDDLVLQNYRLRISQYSTDIETIKKRQQANESELRGLPEQRDRLLHRSRYCLAAAVGFALAIALASIHLLIGGQLLVATALLLLLAGLLAFLNGVFKVWR